LYRRFLKPRARDEDARRREFIFTVLLLATILLLLVAFSSMVINTLSEGSKYAGWPPYSMLIPVGLLVGLYALARRRFTNAVVYPLLGLYLALGTAALYIYGYALPEGLLGYTLVIILAGILISSRGAVIITMVIMGSLAGLSYLQLNHISKPDVSDLAHPLRAVDALVYFFIFLVILLVSWLSNRDIERSLSRARSSEAALRKERNSLEVKVMERTRELEQAQIEKMMELHRFAEFGRLSSSLLHDLANPLTVVSLNLEQMGGKRGSVLINEARKGIAHMERYVQAARRQLQYQSEIKVFSVPSEIMQVIDLLETKARHHAVQFVPKLDPTLQLKGDSIQFDHIISNLIANAIDAYEGIEANTKQIVVEAKRHDGLIKITVRDRGSGISAKELPRIFDAFYTTKGNEHGTGIGLSIVKHAVEQDFSGKITVTSNKRTGTTFTVQLPVTA